MAVEGGRRRLLDDDDPRPGKAPGRPVTIRPQSSTPMKDRRSIDYIVQTGVAGGLAGCAAKTIVAPLDRVKILFQASNPQFAKYTGSWLGVFRAARDINTEDGVRGLFRGHSATLLRIFPYAGIKFLAYEQIRAVVIQSPEQETPARRFVSGSLAGVTSVLFTYPLEVIRVRLAFETKRDSRSSLSRICSQIYGERPPAPPAHSTPAAVVQQATPRSGLINFYRGFTPTLVGMLPYAGMSFLTHDTVGDWLRHPSISQYTILPSSSLSSPSPSPPPPTSSTSPGARPNLSTDSDTVQLPPDPRTPRTQLTAPAELVAGAVAGLVSQTASYPFEVIRRRMQVGGAVGDGHRLRMAETAKMVWRERGWRGYFVGLSIGYLKVVPMAAVSFYVYERGKWWFGIS